MSNTFLLPPGFSHHFGLVCEMLEKPRESRDHVKLDKWGNKTPAASLIHRWVKHYGKKNSRRKKSKNQLPDTHKLTRERDSRRIFHKGFPVYSDFSPSLLFVFIPTSAGGIGFRSESPFRLSWVRVQWMIFLILYDCPPDLRSHSVWRTSSS